MMSCFLFADASRIAEIKLFQCVQPGQLTGRGQAQASVAQVKPFEASAGLADERDSALLVQPAAVAYPKITQRRQD